MLCQRREEKSWGEETLGDEGRKRREGGGGGGCQRPKIERERGKEEGKNEALSRGRDEAI